MLFKKIAIAAAVATTLAFVGCSKKAEDKPADTTATSEAVVDASQAASDALTTEVSAPATEVSAPAVVEGADASAPVSAAQ